MLYPWRMNKQTLPHITIETATNPQASIIWLHGLGADGHDFESIVPQLGLPNDLAIRFIFPHAPSIPVSLNGGYIMPAWYDIKRNTLKQSESNQNNTKQNSLGREHDRQGIHQSSQAIQLLIEQEHRRGIASSRIILAGFSQGAAMALHIGLRQRDQLAGIMALSGYLLLPEDTAEWQAGTTETAVFMAHGQHDPVVDFTLGQQTCRQLESHDYNVEWHCYPMEHSVCIEEIQDIGQWIGNVLGQQ